MRGDVVVVVVSNVSFPSRMPPRPIVYPDDEEGEQHPSKGGRTDADGRIDNETTVMSKCAVPANPHYFVAFTSVENGSLSSNRAVSPAPRVNLSN